MKRFLKKIPNKTVLLDLPRLNIYSTENELIAFCKEHIASYKKPKSVDFVEKVPKNNYGKILKRELRANYWKSKDRQV